MLTQGGCGSIITFRIDATDKLTTRTLPNGVVSSYQYDGLDRLTRLTHSKTGNTLADFQYQFNAVDSITQMTDETRLECPHCNRSRGARSP